VFSNHCYIERSKVKRSFSDGVTGCGLYLALSFLLERMAVEKECDVYLAVRAVKRSRTDFVRSLVMYQCHNNKRKY
jgi:hypothetical protein